MVKIKCSNCVNKAIFLNPNLCKAHFISYFEQKVKQTIDKYKLLTKSDKIVVACSGGKDSTTVLYLLKKFHGKVEALAIDEGINGYRDITLKDLKKICKDNNISLKVFSFKTLTGKTLDEILKKKSHPCTVCGTLRRYLLNAHAEKFDKIATGHNMDDEAQAIMMNLLKSNTNLLGNSSPISKKSDSFTPRIKPLYFCSEKEVATYALLKGFKVQFTECPYIVDSFRSTVRDSLNNYELKNPGTKLNILKKHLDLLSKIDLDSIRKNEYTFNKDTQAIKLIKSFKKV